MKEHIFSGELQISGVINFIESEWATTAAMKVAAPKMLIHRKGTRYAAQWGEKSANERNIYALRLCIRHDEYKDKIKVKFRGKKPKSVWFWEDASAIAAKHYYTAVFSIDYETLKDGEERFLRIGEQWFAYSRSSCRIINKDESIRLGLGCEETFII